MFYNLGIETHYGDRRQVTLATAYSSNFKLILQSSLSVWESQPEPSLFELKSE
ncbi:MAG: hypothetical protein VKJ02_18805 [Snowella sp.]|nr:hypothetical protein [Snowella sp.]